MDDFAIFSKGGDFPILCFRGVNQTAPNSGRPEFHRETLILIGCFISKWRLLKE